MTASASGTEPIADLVRETVARSHRTPLLLYAGTCPKCRLLSAAVVAASLGRVSRVPLEVPQWRAFYDDHYPQAHGYPVLFHRGRVVWGRRVLLVTPIVALRSALRVLGERFGR